MMTLDRTTPPQIVEQAKFHLPEIEEIISDSGMKGLFIQKTKLPMVQFTLIISTGCVLDDEGKSGLANLTAILIDEGAGGLTALELNNQFEMLGSSIQISINHEFMYFTIVSLEEKFSETLTLLSKILNQPHFEETEFLRERSKVLAQLLQIKDEPDTIADKIFEEKIFGFENKLGNFNLGKEEDVQKLTNEDVRNFYNSQISSDRAGFICAGSLDPKTLKNLVNQFVDNFGKTKTSETQLFVHPNKKRRFYFVHKPEAQQTEIRIGNLSDKRSDGDFYAKTVMNTILGGQFNSRINFKLRETKGFTYGANSLFSYRKERGYFLLTTSVQSEHTIEAVQDTFYELNRIKESITADELEAAKLSIIRRFPSNFETYYQLAAGLNTLYIYDLQPSYFDEYISNIRSVTIDDALNAAKNNILDDETVVVLVGNKEQFINQINEFNFDEVEELNESGNPVIAL
ncbi:MAG: pitrilysin family protein [Ignavibacteria bacterium]|nr:pitrilysin family protein [Ignavibacteria bacterium]